LEPDEQPIAPADQVDEVDEVDEVAEASVTTQIAPASEYAADGGHSDSADDAANADDPDSNSNSDVDLDALELDLVDDRDPVR